MEQARQTEAEENQKALQTMTQQLQETQNNYNQLKLAKNQADQSAPGRTRQKER